MIASIHEHEVYDIVNDSNNIVIGSKRYSTLILYDVVNDSINT